MRSGPGGTVPGSGARHGEVRFDGRVAIVTGAGGGMGALHAAALAERGARVVVNDLPGRGADEVVDAITAAGGTAVAAAGSVADEDAVRHVVDTAVGSFGRVDILVNNAGVARPQPFVELDLGWFRQNVDVHLVGSFAMARAVWPHMVEQDYGRVLMITSSAVFGFADYVPYSSAKAGQIGLVKSLALVAPDRNITVNALAPRGRTQMTTSSGIPAKDGTEVPVPPAEEVSPVVLALVHDTTAVTGEVFGTGGGRVDRIFLGATSGVVVDGPTPEKVAVDLHDVLAEEGYWVPVSCTSHADQLWSGGSAQPAAGRWAVNR